MSITYETIHNGYEINTHQDRNLGCYTQYLDKYNAILTYMTSYHSKVLQVRFDLRYPSDHSVIYSNAHISKFCENLRRKLIRMKIIGGHKVDPYILWAREQNSSPYPHYHGLLLVNGNAIRNCHSLLQEVVNQWSIAIDCPYPGLVDFCNRMQNGILYSRGELDGHDILNSMSRQASYLGKTRDKDNLGKGLWTFGGSRI